MLSLILAVLLAQATPAASPSPSIGCFTQVMEKYNSDMKSSTSVSDFSYDFDLFKECAQLAVDSKDMVAYFADTVGGMYTQVRMAMLEDNSNPAQACQHWKFAKWLGDEATSVESQFLVGPPDPNFQGVFSQVLDVVKTHSNLCKESIYTDAK